MTGGWKPWQRLLPVWLPLVLLCVANLALYGWMTSESLGRAAQLGREVSDLEADLARLRRAQRLAAEERLAVETLNRELERLRADVFGSLDQRLTAILRAIGEGVRDASLMPGNYGYGWSDEKDIELVRFEITFAVEGEYAQLRRMLSNLQSSPQFLIVSRLSLAGEAQATTRELRIGVTLATYLARADREQLKALGPERPPQVQAVAEAPAPTSQEPAVPPEGDTASTSGFTAPVEGRADGLE